MNSCVPIRRDLRKFPFHTALPPEFCSSPSWEIPVRTDRDVLWSVVLAYLNPAVCFRSNTVENRIKLLLQSKRRIEKKYLNCVNAYNPFLSKSRCVCDDLMEDIVEIFRGVVEDYCKMNNVESLGPMEIIQGSALLLSCQVFSVFRDNNTGKVECSVFPVSSKYPQRFNEFIVIFGNFFELDGKQVSSFSFAITGELGLQKQKSALKEILTITEISDQKHEIKRIINDICLLPGVTENFIISLVKSDLHESILYLYKSPYVLSKLCDAQFIVDPIAENSKGLSALFYALDLEKNDVFYFLYGQAVNGYFLAPGTIRSPDPIIVENLMNVKSYLDSLKEKVKANSDSKRCRSLLKELCRFNEFQKQACSRISSARQRVHYYSGTGSEDWEEAEERRQVILCILQTYGTFFRWNDEEEDPSQAHHFQLFKNFLEHADYFDHLDFCAAVMFFDNLYSLKERLLLPDRRFSKIESQFFFFIYCRKYFEAEKKTSSPLYIINRTILFQERAALERKLASFKKNLEKEEITEENLISPSDDSSESESSRKKVKRNDDRTLTELPEIYGEILLCKLKLYINAAIKVPLNDIKAKFVIQRALYVLGESVKESDFKSIQKVLTFSLPAKLLSYLKQIRNTMRHPYSYQILFREKVEENMDVLKTIQQELKDLLTFLKPVFRAHDNKMEVFNLKITLKAVGKARKKEPDTQYITGLKAILPSSDTNLFQTDKQVFDEGWNKYFNGIYFSLQKKLISISRDCKVMNKSHVLKYYKTAISNLILAIEKKLATEFNVDIDSMFWSLEFLLTYLVNDKSMKSFRREFLKVSKFRISSIRKYSKLERKANIDQATVINMEAEDTSKQISSSTDASHDGDKDNNKLLIQDMKEAFHEIKAEDTSDQVSSLTDASHDGDKGNNRLLIQDMKEDLHKMEAEDTFKQISSSTDASHDDDEDKNRLQNQEDMKKALHKKEYVETFDKVSLNGAKDDDHKDYKEMLIQDMKEALQKYQNLSEKMFSCFGNSPEDSSDLSFESIEKFRSTLKTGKEYLTKEEGRKILKNVPNKYKTHHFFIEKIKEFLNSNGTKASKEEAHEAVFKLEISESRQQELINDMQNERGLDSISSIPDYYKELKEAIDRNEVGKGKFDCLCKNLELNDSSRDILSKIVIRTTEKVPANQFEFYRSRVKYLKEILIDAHRDIKLLWETAKSERKKAFLEEKLIRIYLSDPAVQASVEMLLFDCMAVLNAKDLKKLWHKTENLMRGIYLKNVLAHGNPLLETLGRFLDPCDLPSQLIKKVLMLIRDEGVLDAIQELCQKSDGKFGSVMGLLNDQDGDEVDGGRRRLDLGMIKNCDRWMNYVYLLPRQTN